jgi:hypothetical protein
MFSACPKRPPSTGVPKADPTLFLRFLYFRAPGKRVKRHETALKADLAGIGIALIDLGKVTNLRGAMAVRQISCIPVP